MGATEAREAAAGGYAPPAAHAPNAASAAVAGDGAPAEVRVVDLGPRVVSPAWELELLISGAVTFGLFQLPPLIRETFAALAPRAVGGGQAVLFFTTLYARATVYVLLVTFLLNLIARAYWVGLVGLQSVYPAGPRWSEYKSGPFLRELYQRRLSSLSRVTGRVDDFASVLFSFGFLIAVIVVLSCAAAAALGGIAYLIGRAVPGAPRTAVLMNWLFALLFAPLLVIALVDKYVGPRLRPDGAGARALRRAVRYSYAMGAASLIGPVFVTLFTNLKRRTFYPLFYAAFTGAIGLAAVNFLADLGALDGGTAVYAPEDADLRGVHAEHYESLRAPGVPAGAVTIQSDIVTDPYLRLHIPYDAERLNVALPRVCPDVAAQRTRGFHVGVGRPAADTGAAGQSADRVLACVARVYAVTLDGRPVPSLRLRFGGPGREGGAGFVGYVPLAGVTPGEHVLRVNRLAALPRPGGPARPARPPLEIPFWK